MIISYVSFTLELNRKYCGWRGGTYIGHPFDPSGESQRCIPQDKGPFSLLFPQSLFSSDSSSGHIAMTYVALAQLLILGT